MKDIASDCDKTIAETKHIRETKTDVNSVRGKEENTFRLKKTLSPIRQKQNTSYINVSSKNLTV